MNKFSFTKGLQQLKVKDVQSAKAELYKVFGINNRNTFRLHQLGKIEPTISEASGVESVFLKYGVKPKDVWGDC